MARPTTATVPQSPPKRVTRARARGAAAAAAQHAETVDTAPETKPKTRSKAATASTTAKAVSKTKKTEQTKASSTDIIEPRTRTAKKYAVKNEVEAVEDDSDGDDELEVVKSVKGKPKPPTTRTRAAAASARPATRGTRTATAAAVEDEDDDDEDELARINSPKKRTTRARAATATKKDADVTKAAPPKRGRPAKATTTAGGNKTETEPAKAPKTTRTRPTRTVVTAASAASAAAKAKTNTEAPKRKKVTFQDLPPESDKENQPLQDKKKTTAADSPASGLRAKPVRGAPASSRGRKAEKKDVQPLSPKKATQVAKSASSVCSGDDEDELSGAKTELHVISRSPVKGSTLNRSMGSPVKKIDFGTSSNGQKDTTALDSANEIVEGLVSLSNPPEASIESAIMGSPARKLPPTPYKDSMRESPKRGGFTLEDDSTSNQQLALRPHSSPLKASPKKGNFGTSFTPSKSSGTPFNAKISLLKSPAKKVPSPLKPATSPSKTDDAIVDGVEPEQNREQMEVDDKDALAEFVIREDADGDVFNDDQPELDFEKSVLDIGEPLDVPEDNVHEPPQYMDVTEDGDIDELDGVRDDQKENDNQLTVTETFSEPSSPAIRYEVSESDDVVDPIRGLRDIPPAAPSPPAQATINPAAFDYRWEIDDEEGSDDEPMPSNSPIRRRSTRLSLNPRNTPRAATPKPSVNFEEDLFQSSDTVKSNRNQNIGFTPLAAQLSNWNPATPAEQKHTRTPGRGIFSPIKRAAKESRKSLGPRNSEMGTNQTFFEEEMAIREDEEQEEEENEMGQYDVDDDVNQPILEDFDHGDGTTDFFPESDDDEIYGDENATPLAESTIPIDAQLFEEEASEVDSEDDKENKIQPNPMALTPVRRERTPRTIHTVSKVPLKAEGEVSPIKVPKKRSRSLSSYASNNPAPNLSKSQSDGSLSAQKLDLPGKTRSKDEGRSPSKNNPWSTAGTPVKSPRKNLAADSQVLRGAVVYADVHTTDGADASGIFVELLNQMGARCVKNWTWNPRMSLSPVDGVDPKEGKIGITHVIYKDGSMRTLEKVKETAGVVKCVGVGWVLDCERENKWLDESDYSVDLSLVPRSGSKRRKSMEPKALSNVNGTLVKLNSSTPSASSRRAASEWGTMEEFIRLSPTPPVSPREGRDSTPEPASTDQGYFSTPKKHQRPTNPVPETPVTSDYGFDYNCPDTINQSPTTPYYLSQGAKLVQQTCPPKQLREGLFPVSGKIEDQPDQNLRIRLEAARRKSLIWKPKVGSPLSR